CLAVDDVLLQPALDDRVKRKARVAGHSLPVVGGEVLDVDEVPVCVEVAYVRGKSSREGVLVRDRCAVGRDQNLDPNDGGAIRVVVDQQEPAGNPPSPAEGDPASACAGGHDRDGRDELLLVRHPQSVPLLYLCHDIRTITLSWVFRVRA